MVNRKKAESAIQNLARDMERVINEPDNNKKKHKKFDKEAFKTNVAIPVVGLMVVVGLSALVVYSFNKFLDKEHERIKNDVRQEIENALAEKQNMTDTVAYNANQNTK